MERRVHLWLVVLTLLQLCQAENMPPRWDAEKIQNQPRPISETYNSEPNFSTAMPIIVSSPSNNYVSEEDYGSSTLSPPSSIQPEFRTSRLSTSSPTFYTSERLSSGFKNIIVTKPIIREASTTPLPPLYEVQDNIHQLHNYRQMDLQRQHQRAFANPQIQPYVPNIAPLQPHLDVEPRLQMVSEVPSHVQRKMQVQQHIEPLGQTFNPSLPVNNLFQTQTPSTPRVTMETGSTAPLTSPTSTVIPVVVDEDPQLAVTNFNQPPSPSQPASSTFVTQSTFSDTPSTMSTPLEIRTSERSTSRFVPITETATSTTFLSTSQRNPTSRVLTSSVTVTPSSTTGSTPAPCNRVISSTQTPLAGSPGAITFPLKIRVIAPSGSITNVNINPVSPTPKTTTRRPTTTRKPTTKRTSKPKRNTYERCLDGCKKVRDPICAAPVSQIEIDPKTLKGFPSVCHMACHNSYKAIAYEKVVDGSCGKLRTRIRPLDSKTKLKNVDLVKTQYFVDQGGPNTIIELIGDVRNKK